VIEVQGLTKRYGRTTAVDDLNFSVRRGEILGFLGPNGAGKTTTMRVLTCYLPPTLGKVTVAGYDVMEQPLEVKKRVGYLPETPPLYTDMRVREMLGFAARIKGAEATIMAGLGHFPVSEDPARFLAYLRPVLADILARER